MVTFSIIICTYNGAERMPETLGHLARLSFSEEIKAELLVVNNASNDDTDNIVENIWNLHNSPFDVKLLHMPLAGKNNALALGIREAKGDFVVICDDDNWLSPDYLLLAKIYFDNNQGLGILGGYVTAESNNPLPDWFLQYQAVYACGPQSFDFGKTTRKQAIWGAGMVIKMNLAKLIFEPEYPMLLTCRRGNELISGGDDEICYRAWILGYKSYYGSDLKLKHFMPDSRLTVDYREKLIAGFAHQVPVIGAYNRFLEMQNFTGNKVLFFLKKLVAWIFYKFKSADRQAMHASDFLYYISGATLWQREETRLVKKFAESVEKIEHKR